MKVNFDMPKMERSLRRFSKDFGETSAQAVVRWSVQTCRELAVESLPFGKKSSENKRTQKAAIERDLGRVVFVDDQRAKSKRGGRILRDAREVLVWLDSNKSGYKNRTKKLPPKDRKICSIKIFNAAVRLRMRKVGIAKGGWIGAGMDIAKAQAGLGKFDIGKGFLGYAKKHSAFGESKKPRDGFTPAAFVTNKASHVSKDYVLPKSAYDKALGFGLRKTLNWYRSAIRALDKKKS